MRTLVIPQAEKYPVDIGEVPYWVPPGRTDAEPAIRTERFVGCGRSPYVGTRSKASDIHGMIAAHYLLRSGESAGLRASAPGVP